MKRPLLSVITVVFNEVELIERTIKSIISQRNVSLEYVVVDGGSTDGTLDIIKKYDSKIDYWVSSKDGGIYDAMNKGIDVANGKWLHFMNAGDSFCNKLVVSEVFSKSHSNEIITGFVKIVDLNGLWKGYRHPNDVYSSCDMAVENCIAHQATFINRNVFKSIGNFSLDYDVQSDYDFWIRANNNNIKFDFFNKDIANFLDNGISSDRKMGLKSIMQKNNILYNNKMISNIKYIANLTIESANFLFKSFIRFIFGKTLSRFISENNLIKANKEKKIVVDLSIEGATRAGVYVFSMNMQKEMHRISNTPLLTYNNPFNAKSKKGLKRKASSMLRILYTETLVFFIKKKDIVFFPAPEVPFLVILLKKNYIVTIHDLFSWKNPKATTLVAKWRSKLLPYIARNAKLVCTVSEFSRQDISSLLNIDLNKIVVVPNGLSENFLISSDNKNNCKSNESYILNVGSIEPRKNIIFLLEVFLLLKNKDNNNLKLILTGSESWGSGGIFQAIKIHKFSNDIIVKGYVDDDDLPVLYKNAVALVFPSIEEGFGIPVIESLSQGTPVIVNNNTALAHFKGYGATVLDNFNADEWAIELNNIIENLTRVNERDVRNVINYFSWKKSSKLLLDEIDKL